MTGATESLFTKATYYKKREGLGSPQWHFTTCIPQCFSQKSFLKNVLLKRKSVERKGKHGHKISLKMTLKLNTFTRKLSHIQSQTNLKLNTFTRKLNAFAHKLDRFTCELDTPQTEYIHMQTKYNHTQTKYIHTSSGGDERPKAGSPTSNAGELKENKLHLGKSTDPGRHWREFQ